MIRKQEVDEESLLINSNQEELINDDQIENNESININDGDHDTRSDSLGFFAVIFLTVNATLGAGLLNIPYSFDNSGGILFAVAFQLIHMFLVIASLMILSFCAKISHTDSLQSLVEFYCGSGWSKLCSCSIFIYSYGACITYLIIIGDQFDNIFEFYYGLNYYKHWFMNRDYLVMTISIIMILPLCVSKEISFLKFASFIGFLSTLYITVLVLIEYIKLSPKNVKIKTKPDHWTELFKVLPVLTFSYQCQTSWVPTYAEIRDKRNFPIFSMIFCSMFICFLSYTWTAVFGLLTFGSASIQKDMMQNYDPRDPFVALGMALLIVKTIVIYPVLLYCGRIVIEKYFSQANSTMAFQPKSIRIITATVWVISSATLAIFVPNIAIAINYLGSLANLFVFILPGLCIYLMLFQSDNDYQLLVAECRFFANKFFVLVVAIFFISYGVGVFAYSLSISILELVHELDILVKRFHRFHEATMGI